MRRPRLGWAAAAATEHSIVVATRSDADGDVTITVVEATDADDFGELMSDGQISLLTTRLEVGSVVAATTAQVEIGRLGYVRVRVFVEPAESPSSVTVALDPSSRRRAEIP